MKWFLSVRTRSFLGILISNFNIRRSSSFPLVHMVLAWRYTRVGK